MIKTDKSKVFIERPDRFVEKDSRSGVLLARKPKTREEIEQTLIPEQLPVDGKMTTEATNLEDIPRKVASTKKPTKTLKNTNHQRMLHPKTKRRKAKKKRRSS